MNRSFHFCKTENNIQLKVSRILGHGAGILGHSMTE